LPEKAAHLFYDAVIACIREADSILIFGPGEAKNELENRLEKKDFEAASSALRQLTK
jgi:stalled ribosome rescue protein Dom34